MAKQLSPAAIMALKEALCSVYWYKSDLKGFLQLCLANPSLLQRFDWTNYKRQIVSDLIDQLVSSPEQHIGDLTKICFEVSKMSAFPHLQSVDDAATKIKRAQDAVSTLKTLVDLQQSQDREDVEIKKRQAAAAQKLERNIAVRHKLDEIRVRYTQLVCSTNPQSRGFALEKVMYDVFELFDLDPKASFKNTGEQIDGAFTLDGTEYLFEAKWQQEAVNKADLAVFADKVRTKLENTLGVFLSIGGFSAEGVTAHQAGGSAILLMDGGDLMAVLDERMDFVTLLLRKKRYAAQTGNIYLSYFQMNGNAD